jgi:hypothetical protein
MKNLLIFAILTLSTTLFANTKIHLTVMPVKGTKAQLLKEVRNNLERTFKQRLRSYNCKEVEITKSADIKEWDKPWSTSKQVFGLLEAVASDCDKAIENTTLIGYYDRDAQENGRSFNIHLRFVDSQSGDSFNSLSVNFKQDLK